MDDSPDSSQRDEQLAGMLERIWRLEQALKRHGISLDDEMPQAAAGQNAPAIAGPAAQLQHAPAEEKIDDEKRSLESRIGSQWLNRVGILAVLVGVAWFMKFAVDNAWIGPLPRVLIGLGAGIGLMVWARQLAVKGYRAFSYSIQAVGSGVLYLALWAAFSLYHFVPVSVAFVLMAAVTVLNGILAWRQDAELLGFYALAGGFVTPALLSTKSDHEAVLFAYLLMLDLSLLALALVKPWPRMMAGAFAGTAIAGAAWAFRYYTAADRWQTFVFAAALCMLFAAVPLGMRRSEADSAWSPIAFVFLPVANAVFGFTALGLLLPHGSEIGLAGVALSFAALSAMLVGAAKFTRGTEDTLGRERRWFGYVHTWLAAIFVAAAIALRLHGVWITAGWLAEGLILLVSGFWSNRALLRWQALVLLALAIGKVFLVDIGEKSAGYRIASFLGLGVLLLLVSFLYQRDWLRLRR